MAARVLFVMSIMNDNEVLTRSCITNLCSEAENLCDRLYRLWHLYSVKYASLN